MVKLTPRCARLLCALWFFCAVLSSAGLVRATPEEAAMAEKLFQEGRDAMDGGDYETACDKFGESQRLDPGAGALMNWAACEEKLQRVASAWQHWREAMSLLRPDDPRVQYAEERSQALEPQVPYLTVVLAAGAPPGSRVVLDDAELGSASLGSALPVDPGEWHITVHAPGRVARAFKVRIELADKLTIKVSAGAPQAVQDEPVSLAPYKWAALGVGVVGIAGGVVTGVLAKDRRDTVDQNCDANSQCNAAGATAAREGETLVTLNTVSWVVAAVGVGAGVTLWILDDSGSSEEPASAKLGVSPTVGGAALQFRSRF